MRIWTHPWCLKLEALRRPEKFVDTDSMDDFVVHTDEEEEEEEEEDEMSLKSTSSEEDEEEVESSSESEEERRRKKHDGRRGKRVLSSDEDDIDESEDEVLPQSSRKKAAAARNAHSASNKASSSTVKIDGEDITVVSINDGAGPSQQTGKDKREQPHSSKDSKPGDKKDAMATNNAKPSTSKDSNPNSETNSYYGSTRSGASFKDGSDVEIEEEKEWYDEFLQEDDEYNVELSGKLVLLMEILADAEAVHDKVLVFSQSLVTLDLIEKMLGGGEIGGDRENWCRGCDYFRMDGSTSAAMRQRWADIFNDEDNKR